MKYNLHLHNQRCPNCGNPLLGDHWKLYKCSGPTIEQMHEALKRNLKISRIIDEIPVKYEC